MRTITAYGIAVIIVFAILNGIFWLVGNPRLHDLNVFSAGFVLGMRAKQEDIFFSSNRYIFKASKPPSNG
jgi:hypothetical protein